MTTAADIRAKFWKALKSDRVLMLGVEGSGEAQPMTAQRDGNDDSGPLYFFTAKDTDLVEQIGPGAAAVAYFTAKSLDLFASMTGSLALVEDRVLVDRLWSPFVAAWFKGGKDDPKLQLVRFDADHAHIWLNENSMFAGVKLLLGADPKEDYADKVADVRLGTSQSHERSVE